MTMDIRRIQITGGSSYMVTLPKEWAESVNLKKNDPIRLETQPDGSLLIYPNNYREKVDNPRIIDAIGDSVFLYRQLIGAYIAGHREIIVKSEIPISGNTAAVVSGFTQTSIGMEIIEEDEKHIVIKDLMNHNEMRPTKSLERMKVLVMNMISDTYDSAFSGNFKILSNMDHRDTEVDRIYWLLSRQGCIYQKDVSICRKLDIDLNSLGRELVVSRMLERIGDHIVIISNNLTELDNEGKIDSVAKSLCGFGKEMVSLFNDSARGWFDTDMDVAENCIERGAQTVEKIKKSFGEIPLDSETASPTSMIASSSRRIAEYCIDISEQTINEAMN